MKLFIHRTQHKDVDCYDAKELSLSLVCNVSLFYNLMYPSSHPLQMICTKLLKWNLRANSKTQHFQHNTKYDSDSEKSTARILVV